MFGRDSATGCRSVRGGAPPALPARGSRRRCRWPPPTSTPSARAVLRERSDPRRAPAAPGRCRVPPSAPRSSTASRRPASSCPGRHRHRATVRGSTHCRSRQPARPDPHRICWSPSRLPRRRATAPRAPPGPRAPPTVVPSSRPRPPPRHRHPGRATPAPPRRRHSARHRSKERPPSPRRTQRLRPRGRPATLCARSACRFSTTALTGLPTAIP